MLSSESQNLSESYYRAACEDYRKSGRTLYLPVSNVKTLLQEALRLDATNLLAAEMLFFLYRDLCKQLLQPEYLEHSFEIYFNEAMAVAKILEMNYPLVGVWRLVCFYEELMPLVSVLGLDYSYQIQKNLESATKIFFNGKHNVYPCADNIDAVVDRVYISLPAEQIHMTLVSKNISGFVINQYKLKCAELTGILTELGNVLLESQVHNQYLISECLMNLKSAFAMFPVGYSARQIHDKVVTLRGFMEDNFSELSCRLDALIRNDSLLEILQIRPKPHRFFQIPMESQLITRLDLLMNSSCPSVLAPQAASRGNTL